MSSSSEESDPDTPPRKKTLKYEQKFIDSWLQDEKFKGWLKKSSKGINYFFCSACKCDRKCGMHELLRHKSSKKHEINCKTLVKQPTLTSMLSKSQDPKKAAKKR